MAIQSRFITNNGLDNNSKTISSIADPINTQDGINKAFASNASNITSGTLNSARIPDYNTWLNKITNAPTIQPSLNLDFVNSNTLDSRITFTRSSIATRTNSAGLIETVGNNVPRFDYDPITKVCKGLLIEESRTNLLTYSNNFDNASWIKSKGSITKLQYVNPVGGIETYKIIEDTTTGQHVVAQNYNTTNQTLTFSIYAKAGERTKLLLQITNTINEASNGFFDLSAGTIISNSTSGTDFTGTSANIMSIGNGWYRCSLTTTKNAVNNIASAYISPVNVSNSANYAGDGVSGLYIWGAQLEAGSFATSYIPSTDTFTSRASTATYIGSDGLIKTATNDIARYSYNPTNLSVSPQLLLEAASTNLLTYSEQFDNAAWTKVNANITANSTVAPDGTMTADKLYEDTTAGIKHQITTGIVSNAVSNTTAYTFSCFVKAGERTITRFFLHGGAFTTLEQSIIFDLSNNSWTVGSGNVKGQIIDIVNGWKLCSITAIATDTSTTLSSTIRVGSLSSNGDGVSGIYIWGAQLEQSSFASSYIPTTSAQVTRAADVSSSAQTTRANDAASITGNNFSSWINQTEGTLTFEGDFNYSKTTADYPRLVCLVGANANLDNIAIYTRTTGVGNYSGMLWGGITVNGTGTMDTQPSGQTVLGSGKGALAYKTNDSVIAANGLVASTYTNVALPTNLTELRILGIARYQTQPTGHIRKLLYYPQRLSNTTLQSLTL